MKREKINNNKPIDTAMVDSKRSKVIGTMKKYYLAFPLTIIAVVVLMFVLFSMSPALNDIVFENASAYDITANSNNYLSQVEFNGKVRDGASITVISTFNTTSAGVATFWATADMRTGGSITSVDVTFVIAEGWYTGHGYTGNNTNFMTKTRLTISITNPSAVETTVTWYDYITYAGTGVGTFTIEGDIPDYTFSVAGTYQIGYTYETYY